MNNIVAATQAIIHFNNGVNHNPYCPASNKIDHESYEFMMAHKIAEAKNEQRKVA